MGRVLLSKVLLAVEIPFLIFKLVFRFWLYLYINAPVRGDGNGGGYGGDDIMIADFDGH